MFKIGSIIILVAICLSTPAMADSKYPALRDSVDPELQKAFDKALTDYFGAEFWELAQAKKVGIATGSMTRNMAVVWGLAGITAAVRSGNAPRLTIYPTAPVPCRWPGGNTWR